MDNVTVKLAKPIEHDGKTISELTFREPQVGDMMAADAVKGDFSRLAAVLALCCGLPLPVFKRVSARDMATIMQSTAALVGNELAGSTGGDPDLPASIGGVQ